jgi:hypothetical protein
MSFRLRATHLLLLFTLVLSCKKDDPLPNTTIQFLNANFAVLEFGADEKVDIDFSSPLQSDIDLTITINDSTAIYGEDYTTVPDGSTKMINIHVSKGSVSSHFDIIPIQQKKPKYNRIVNFTLTGQYDKAQLGLNTKLRTVISDDASVAQFSSAGFSLHETSSSRIVNLSLSAPLQHDGFFVVDISDSTSLYGREYTTTPDGSSKTISIPVLKGATTASFTIQPLLNSKSDGEKFVRFSLKSFPPAVQVGPLSSQKISIIDDDLVCYLPMNGNAQDASRYSNISQSQYATLTTGRNSLSNTAYLMDGLSSDIVVTNSKVLDTINTQITLTAWIKPISFYGNGNNAIIEKPYTSHTNPYYQYKLGITGDQRTNLPGSFIFSLSINGNYVYVSTSSNAWSPGNWYFVVGTYDGAKMVLYVNGIQLGFLNIQGKIDSWGTDIYLGKLQNLNVYTPGTFGDMRIYNRALTAKEVGDLNTR